ncbi:MAG: bifunctional nuclease family protein [Synechococcus sp. SB0668_bin_15]|nr:bifunctional nuclease family protein [Synechococcus sp. SB0668_bin_15]MXZ82881.1 bifunctional nuclease family protein [Synechococcus sp. SB0666_bin_14]MYC49350.1 bifunctional nuclease family protein [Synechococcus sp. SB0662_bin_14]MYG45952.1 bifunctional nuclease family protein [Synechococcus sp. SB0675_bin_6]MYJ59645.1 bifunctional nuclease family protein [Synechococcus sp. SB0672_bin_6]MYK92273.1 bifunctional nuclease family protein [Synechococcus sp. SB0669_bin_8]
MVEMGITGIILDAASHQPIVLLRDPDGRRQVPIWVDKVQAHSIILGLKGLHPPRPMTHDLMLNLLQVAKLEFDRIVISSIQDSTFHAELRVRRQDQTVVSLDCRPSDAIALAVRSKTSIWMVEEVVSDASIPVDAEADAMDTEAFHKAVADISPAELIRRSGVNLDSPEQTTDSCDDPHPEESSDSGS